MINNHSRTHSILSENDYIINPKEKILITGAGGYVGSKVVDILFSYGFKNVRCLIRSVAKSINLINLKEKYGKDNLEVLEGNLLSKEDCEYAVKDTSVIYHLAAGVGKSYPGCFLNSVVTTKNLLDAAIKIQGLKRFVNISSIAVYSNEKLKCGGLLDESCPVDDNIIARHEAYTYGKVKQDQLVLDYFKRYNLPYVIVRPSVVFGPGKINISGRIGSDTFGLFLHLGLNNIIPLTYIDNCAEAIILSGLRKGIDGQVFNILDDDLPRSRDFLRLYKKKVRKFLSIPVPYPLWYLFNFFWEKYSKWSKGQLPPVFNRRSCAVYWKGNIYSNTKAKDLLGWKPRVPMREGLEKYFDYIKKKMDKK